jgi:chromosome segregation ATPase
MQLTAKEKVLELEAERRQLRKAEADIEDGWSRLRSQQDLVDHLKASGMYSPQADRLIDLLKQTLIEWERHRTLIEQRIAYLEKGPLVDPQA